MPGTDLILASGELISIPSAIVALDKRVEIALGEGPGERAELLENLRMIEHEIGTMKRALMNGLAHDSSLLGKKTFDVGHGRRVAIGGGEETVVDAEKYEAGLRRAGMPEERIDEIVTTTVSRKVNLVKAKQAASANEAYARVLKRASTTREKAVTVSIEKG